MSNYLRDVLGAGNSSSAQPQGLVADVGPDIPGGEGANKGFWRRQLKDKLERFAKMYGHVMFDMEVEGLGRITGHGKIVDASGPRMAVVRVKNHPVLPDGDYEIPSENFETVAAVIPDKDYKRITAKNEAKARIPDKDFKGVVENVKEELFDNDSLSYLGIDFQTATMDADGARLPTPGAFTGKFQELMSDAQNWKEVQDRLRGQTVIYFDFETTGISDYDGDGIKNDPVQLGAVKVKDGKVIERFNLYINPGSKLSEWSANNLKRDVVDENGNRVLDENGKPASTLVTPEWLEQQTTPENALRQFIEFIGPQALLGGQNVPFDMEILKRMADSAGLQLDVAGTIDSKDLASLLPKYDAEKGTDGPKQVDKKTGELRASSSLGPVANFLGFEPANWHSADGDAEDSYNLVSKIIDRAAQEDSKDTRLLDFELQENQYKERMDAFKQAVSKDNPVTERQQKALEKFSESDSKEIASAAKKALAEAKTRGEAAQALEAINAINDAAKSESIAQEETAVLTMEDLPASKIYSEDRYTPVTEIGIEIKGEDLESDEFEAMENYMGADYTEINAALLANPNMSGEEMVNSVDPSTIEATSVWGGEVYKLEDTRAFELISLLDSAFAKSSLKNDAVLYRGLHLSGEQRDALLSLKPGDVLTDSRFMSATTSLQVANEYATRTNGAGGYDSPTEGYVPVLYRIKASKGTPAFYSEDIVASYSIDHLVIARNLPLTVENISKTNKGVLVIDLKTPEAEAMKDWNPTTSSSEEEAADEEDGPSIAEMIKDIEENPEKYPPLLPKKPADTPKEQVGVTHSFGGKEYYFSPEELQKAVWYISDGAIGAKDATDEEGQEFNLRMRALSDYLSKRSGGVYKTSVTESVEDMEKVTGDQIPVNELRHSAPPFRFDDIEENGIRPKITDKIGTDNYIKTRFGVFLANGYTSSEAGPGADIFRVVNVPKSELKVDPYTRNGRNLYVERTIKPEELELLGHNPLVNIDESLLNEEGLHDGNSAKCTICHPELEAANPTTEPKELSTWDRIKLRDLKIDYRDILDDPEVAEIFESSDVENIENLLKEKGLSRKAYAVSQGADQIADAENLYSEIDPNLDVESTTNPAAVNATLPGSKLGAVGYLEAQGVIDLIKENFILNKELREVQKKEIEENGFSSPVILIYDSNTGKYLLKDPEMDSARLLAARDMRPRRYAPVVVEIDGESYHPFFAKNMEMSFPEEFTPKDINYNYYPDTSGISDLPIQERTQEQKDAISTYRGWDYSVLKSVMEDPYNTRNLSTEDREKLEKYIDTLDKLTSTEPLPEGTELYRGVSLSGMGEDAAAWSEYFSNLQPGDKITTPVWFTSTTLDKTVAESYATPGRIYDKDSAARSAVVMKITTKDGATGTPFEFDNTVFGLEKEVLLPMMPNLTVTNVYRDSDGILRIDLDYGADKKAAPEERSTGLFNEYSPERADEITAENTPLTDLGFDPEEEITIYRGVPNDVDSINSGDWVTTLPQLAKDYAGADGKVISTKVKAKDLLADPSSGEGAYTEEMVYRPETKKEFKGTVDWEPKEGLTTGKGESELLDTLVDGDYLDVEAIKDGDVPRNFDLDELTEEQAESLRYYKGSGFRFMNNFLRYGQEDLPDDKADLLKTDISNFDELIDTYGDVYTETTVFRGMVDQPKIQETDVNLVEMLESVRPGDIISDPGYTATTTNRSIAINEFGLGMGKFEDETVKASQEQWRSTAFFAIKLPEGSKALGLPLESNYGRESEVVLPRDAKLKINAIRKVPQVDEDGNENGRFNYFVDATVQPQVKNEEATPAKSVDMSGTRLSDDARQELSSVISNLDDATQTASAQAYREIAAELGRSLSLPWDNDRTPEGRETYEYIYSAKKFKKDSPENDEEKELLRIKNLFEEKLDSNEEYKKAKEAAYNNKLYKDLIDALNSKTNGFSESTISYALLDRGLAYQRPRLREEDLEEFAITTPDYADEDINEDVYDVTVDAEESVEITNKDLKEFSESGVVAVIVPSGALEKVLEEGRMKTVHETRSSMAGESTDRYRALRVLYESVAFGYKGDSPIEERPVYGLLRSATLPPPEDALAIYGGSKPAQIVLKPEVKDRTTISDRDSLNNYEETTPLTDPKFKASDLTQRVAVYREATGENFFETENFAKFGSIEAQIHGGVKLEDIDRVVFYETPSEEMRELLTSKGIIWEVSRLKPYSKPRTFGGMF